MAECCVFCGEDYVGVLDRTADGFVCHECDEAETVFAVGPKPTAQQARALGAEIEASPKPGASAQSTVDQKDLEEIVSGAFASVRAGQREDAIAQFREAEDFLLALREELEGQS
jgi:hypothetical protein